MKNRVITTLMSRAAMAASLGSAIQNAPPAPTKQPHKTRSYGSSFNDRELLRGVSSTLRKAMRDARHNPVWRPPAQADKYLNAHARYEKNLDRFLSRNVR